MYYNTTEEKETEAYENKAKTQDKKVLEIIRESTKPIGASNIEIGAPITSVRRSINSLLMKLLIERVGKQSGIYGRPEYVYEARDVQKKDLGSTT